MTYPEVAPYGQHHKVFSPRDRNLCDRCHEALAPDEGHLCPVCALDYEDRW